MMTPYDFEFQFGPNRTLKGRGWRGVVALCVVVVVVCVATDYGRSTLGPPIKAAIGQLKDAVLSKR